MPKHDDEPKTIYDLPDEVIGNISSYLDRLSLYQVMLATRHFGKSKPAINEMNYRKYLKLLNPAGINPIAIPMQSNISYAELYNTTAESINAGANQIYQFLNTLTFKWEWRFVAIPHYYGVSDTDALTLTFIPPEEAMTMLRSIEPDLLASSLNKALQIAEANGEKDNFLNHLGERKDCPLVMFFIYLLDMRCVQLLVNNRAEVNEAMLEAIYLLLIMADENYEKFIIEHDPEKVFFGKEYMKFRDTLHNLTTDYSFFKNQLLSITKVLSLANKKVCKNFVMHLLAPYLDLASITQKIHPIEIELFKLTISLEDLDLNKQMVAKLLQYRKIAGEQQSNLDEQSAKIIEHNFGIVEELILYAKGKFVVEDLISANYQEIIDVDIIAELHNIGFEFEATASPGLR